MADFFSGFSFHPSDIGRVNSGERVSPMEEAPQTGECCSKKLGNSRNKPIAYILQELQQTSRAVVSINTIRKETFLLRFHDRVAAHKRLITKSNHTVQLRWCKALRNMTLDE
ncbi:hypothetical protein TNCV_1590871 [Trichonephila clavipes]|nr:hypothetical protein TNCV_1590871 [Trichonephila clavipes]